MSVNANANAHCKVDKGHFESLDSDSCCGAHIRSRLRKVQQVSIDPLFGSGKKQFNALTILAFNLIFLILLLCGLGQFLQVPWAKATGIAGTIFLAIVHKHRHRRAAVEVGGGAQCLVEV